MVKNIRITSMGLLLLLLSCSQCSYGGFLFEERTRGKDYNYFYIHYDFEETAPAPLGSLIYHLKEVVHKDYPIHLFLDDMMSKTEAQGGIMAKLVLDEIVKLRNRYAYIRVGIKHITVVESLVNVLKQNINPILHLELPGYVPEEHVQKCIIALAENKVLRQLKLTVSNFDSSLAEAIEILLRQNMSLCELTIVVNDRTEGTDGLSGLFKKFIKILQINNVLTNFEIVGSDGQPFFPPQLNRVIELILGRNRFILQTEIIDRVNQGTSPVPRPLRVNPRSITQRDVPVVEEAARVDDSSRSSKCCILPFVHFRTEPDLDPPQPILTQYRRINYEFDNTDHGFLRRNQVLNAVLTGDTIKIINIVEHTGITLSQINMLRNYQRDILRQMQTLGILTEGEPNIELLTPLTQRSVTPPSPAPVRHEAAPEATATRPRSLTPPPIPTQRPLRVKQTVPSLREAPLSPYPQRPRQQSLEQPPPIPSQRPCSQMVRSNPVPAQNVAPLPSPSQNTTNPEAAVNVTRFPLPPSAPQPPSSLSRPL